GRSTAFLCQRARDSRQAGDACRAPGVSGCALPRSPPGLCAVSGNRSGECRCQRAPDQARGAFSRRSQRARFSVPLAAPRVGRCASAGTAGGEFGNAWRRRRRWRRSAAIDAAIAAAAVWRGLRIRRARLPVWRAFVWRAWLRADGVFPPGEHLRGARAARRLRPAIRSRCGRRRDWRCTPARLCAGAAAGYLYPRRECTWAGAGRHARGARAHHLRADEERARKQRYPVAAAAGAARARRRQSRSRLRRAECGDIPVAGVAHRARRPRKPADPRDSGAAARRRCRAAGARRARRSARAWQLGSHRGTQQRDPVDDGLPRLGARQPQAGDSRNERAAARHGGDRAQRPVQSRPSDLGADDAGRARQIVSARPMTGREMNGRPINGLEQSELPPAIALMGPTASGKTALALTLSEMLPCEIVSVDSALVYRGMDIGTAKPSAAERAGVPHHLIDIRDPADAYSAADFRRDALPLLAQISARGNTPLLVGGTMLYFKILRDGIADIPAADAALRAEITAEA